MPRPRSPRRRISYRESLFDFKRALLGKRPGDRLAAGYSPHTFERLELRAVLSSFTVGNANSSGPGSLPAEVALANAATDAAVIKFDPTVFGTAKTITLTQTLALHNANVGASIEIEGPSAGVTIAGGGSGSDFGVISVAAGTTASIVGASATDPITITRGNETGFSGFGAGIDNSGTLTVSNSVVTGNKTSSGAGGGIRNEQGATLLVSASTISSNTAGDTGGGISNRGTAQISNSTISGNGLTVTGSEGGGIDNAGTMSVVQSTISGNSSPSSGFNGGGGLANELNSTATLLNSTFANNTTGVNGGAVDNFGHIVIANCTISGNTAAIDAGGIESNNPSSTIILTNSIVAGNSVAAGGTNDDADFSTVASSTAANDDLIGSFSPGVQNAGLAGGINGNVFGPPLLAPFGNYGGSTQTFALLPGSPALSAGGPVTVLAADVSATDTTIHVNRNFTLPNPVLRQGYDLLLENEEMRVAAVSGSAPNYTLTVVRGVNGTTAAQHSASGANGIFLATDQRGMPTSVVGVTDMGAFQSQGFNVTIKSGDSPQTTAVSTAFVKPLGVTVTANNAIEPVNGGVITYTVNPGPNNGGANLSSTTATLSGGSASVTATADRTADSYTVDASAIPTIASSGAEFDLTNAPLNELIWTGASSTSSNWSDPANWDLKRAPKAGDDLIFPDNVPRTTNTNDISGLSVNSITFQGTQTTPTAAYVIGGQPLTIGAGGIVDGTSGDSTHQRVDQLNMDITLGAAQTWNMGITPPSIATADFATLALGGAVNLSTFNLTCSGGDTQDVFDFKGAIDGSGKILASMALGLNFVSLDHANSYTGGTEVVSGDLAVTADGALGPGGSSDGGTKVDSAPAGNEAFIDFATNYITPEKLTVLSGAAGSAGSGVGGGINPSSNQVVPAAFAGPVTFSGATASIETIGPTLTFTGNIAAGSTALTLADRSPTPATVLINGQLTGTGTMSVNSNVNFGFGTGGTTTLAGTGTTNLPLTVASGSTLQPGGANLTADTGTLNTADVTFKSGSTFATQLNGPSAGEFDQLNSTGTVALGSATLNVTSVGGFVPGTSFVIIKSANPIAGTFAQGNSITAGGQTFNISYANDEVTLTVAGTGPQPSTLTWTGAVDANWSTARNWTLPDGSHRAPINGDSLIFPDGIVTRTTNKNDLNGLSLNSITFQAELSGPTATPYTITGNAVTIGAGGITDGVDASANALHTDQLNLNVTLSANQSWSFTTTAPSINASRFETLVLGGIVDLSSFNLDLVANTGETNDVFQLGGAINGSGKLSVDTSTGAIVWLTQTDGYTGGTLVNSGTLLVTADGALGPAGSSDGGTTLGNGNTTVGNEAGLVVDTTYDTPENVTIDNGVIAGGFNPVTATTAPASFAGPITFNSSNGQLDIALAGEPFTLTGNVTFGNFDLHAVNENPKTAATLIVDGTVTGGGTLQVLSGANFGGTTSGPLTLAGTGTVKGAITVSAGSTLEPGGANAATDTGTLTNTANVTFQKGSTFSVQLNGTAAGQFDQLSSGGSVDLSDAALILNAKGSFAAGSTFVILKSGAPITTTFLSLPEGSTTFAGSQNFTVSYKNDEVTLTIPGATTPTAITWTGDSLNDSNWSDAANWDLNRAPIDGDTLVFPAGAHRLANTNDIQSLSVTAIQFQGKFGTSTTGYTLGGNAVTIGAGGIVDNSTFTGTSGNLLNQVNFNVVLSVAQSWNIHDSNNAHHLTINGDVANGGFGLIATGTGTIDVAAAISGSGNLTVAESDTSNLITLDLHHANSYTGGTSVINGILDIFADGALGPGGASDAGTTVTANGTLLFHAVRYATPEKLALDGTIGDDSGDSSFAGPITISGNASGTGNGSPVAVDAQVSDVNGGTFTLDGPTLVNKGTADLFVQGGNTTLGGSSNVVINNLISGKGGLLLQAANVQLSAANTYQGSTFLNGAAQLTVAADNAIPAASAVVMQASGSARNGAPLKTTTVAFDNSNSILLGGHSDTIGSLAGTENGGTDAVDLGNGGSLTTGGDNSSTSFVGDIKGSGSLVKQGAGSFDLTGTNDYTGTTTVSGGTLLVDGSTAAGNAVTVGDATLGGAGTVAGLIVLTPGTEFISGGKLSPGAGPDPSKDTGTLNNTAGVTFTQGTVPGSAAALSLQLAGTSASRTNDQIVSAGTVALGNASLDLRVLAGAGPFNAGQQFVIVQAGQPISGTFGGLPEGGTVSDGAQNLTISYTNDRVTLTVQSPPAGQTATYINGQPGDGAAATFVRNLYRELLGRDPDPAGQSFWAGLYTQLSTSGTAASAQQQMVAGFLASAEYQEHLVTGMYHDLLHRDPDSGGLQFWLSAMAAGVDEKQVLAGFLGCDEYYADAGQTAAGLTDALYRDVLGRTPDAGVSFWENLFTSSPSFLPPITDLRLFRIALAEIFLSTPEADHKLLDGDFPSAAGNVGAPGTPAVGAFALADLTGDGWDNLYFQGSLSAANVDALFTSLQGGTSYDDTIAGMLEMPPYFGS